MTGTVNVLVDGFGRLGPLSYYTGDQRISVGDAVRVPFGKRNATGVVTGKGDPRKAQKTVLEVHGPRTTETDLAAASLTAGRQLSDLKWIANRLAPTHHKGASPASAGAVELTHTHTLNYDTSHINGNHVLLLRPPLVKPEAAAAVEAERLSSAGQVLIICPTVELVAKTCNEFRSGAARLDAHAEPGDWSGFRQGTVTIGIGTRASALYAAKNLKGIILLEDQHPGHLESRHPRTHSLDAAAARAQAHRIPLTIISGRATPAAYGCVNGMTTIQAPRTWPRTQLINMREDNSRSKHLPWDMAEKISTRPHDVLIVAEPDTKEHGLTKHAVADMFGPLVRTCTPTELGKFHNVPLIVLPNIHHDLVMPDLTPYGWASDLITNACTAAGPRGTVVATHWGEPHAILKLLMGSNDLETTARGTYLHAKRLNLPPFGKAAEVIFKSTPPDLTGLPGHVHGPLKLDSGGHKVLIRCQPKELLLLERSVQQWRKKKLKFSLHVE